MVVPGSKEVYCASATKGGSTCDVVPISESWTCDDVVVTCSSTCTFSFVSQLFPE